MSLVQALQYELGAQIPHSSSSYQEPQARPPIVNTQPKSDHYNEYGSAIVDDNAAVPSDVAPRVFDVAPLNVMNKARRLVITSLIIVSNLVQVG